MLGFFPVLPPPPPGYSRLRLQLYQLDAREVGVRQYWRTRLPVKSTARINYNAIDCDEDLFLLILGDREVFGMASEHGIQFWLFHPIFQARCLFSQCKRVGDSNMAHMRCFYLPHESMNQGLQCSKKESQCRQNAPITLRLMAGTRTELGLILLHGVSRERRRVPRTCNTRGFSSRRKLKCPQLLEKSVT